MSLRKYVQDVSVDVIAIDGYSGTGKGYQRGRVAKELGYNELDSGVLYRAVGVKRDQLSIAIEDVGSLVEVCKNLNVVSKGDVVLLDNVDQTKLLRSEEAGKLAAGVAQIKEVREALLGYQLEMRRFPGLVADGRDMGTVFRNSFRFFIWVDPKVRAGWRMKQLEELGVKDLDYEKIHTSIVERDKADETREVSPLRRHSKAHYIDGTSLSKEQTFDIIMRRYRTLKS